MQQLACLLLVNGLTVFPALPAFTPLAASMEEQVAVEVVMGTAAAAAAGTASGFTHLRTSFKYGAHMGVR